MRVKQDPKRCPIHVPNTPHNAAAGTGPLSFGVGTTSSSLGSSTGSWSAQGAAGVDWDAVWNAAKAYETRDEFISAMNLLADEDDGTEASGSGATAAAAAATRCEPIMGSG